MYLSTQTFMALAAALAVGINASPLNARATGCTEFDNAPPGSVAQKNAIAACAARGVNVGGASGGNGSAAPQVGSTSTGGDGCFECGPASQFYKPGCHCENTLFVKRDDGQLDKRACLPRSDCGPPSKFYQPGCHCENTLFT
ncbi:MAG: hypothetical protein LQ352_007074 [Teloschistes flavicans]|nr:MAG: hypothetical protein LQ352_007074 [Teloschistes flavicans]